MTVQALHDSVVERTARSREYTPVPYSSLRVLAEDGGLKLIGKSNRPADFTNWSYGQLNKAVGAPASFTSQLPATLASNVLNNRLAARGDDAGDCKLLLDVNGTATVRAFTGVGYSRILDQDITKRALGLAENGWNPAPKTELAQGGDTVGLYESDHDVFLFLVDNKRRVFEKAPGGGLSRGIMIANSEVGDKSFWFLTFLYSYICANHNVWGAEGVNELRIRHVGDASIRAFDSLEVELTKYAEASAEGDELKIERSIKYILGNDKKAVLDKIFGMKSLNLSRKIIGEAFDAAEKHEDWYLAPPTSAWGLGNGLTEVAQQIGYTDERVKVERAAGKIFEMGGAF
jgi:hypothetical protein